MKENEEFEGEITDIDDIDESVIREPTSKTIKADVRRRIEDILEDRALNYDLRDVYDDLRYQASFGQDDY